MESQNNVGVPHWRKEIEMEQLVEFLGSACGLVMRIFDWLTGKRRTWHEESDHE